MSEATVESIKHIFHGLEQLGRSALEQVSLDEIVRAPGDELNSIAVIVQHLHGNMRSRWTDFLTTDGEKEWRERDKEFEQSSYRVREDVLALWDEGWACLFAAVDALESGDLLKQVTIRRQPHTVVEACHRQIQHVAYHIGQLVLLARMWRGSDWKNLSIPRGQSRAYVPGGAVGEPKTPTKPAQ